MAAQLTYALNLTTGKLVTLTTPDLSAAFVDKPTDSLFVAVEDGATALFQGTTRDTGTWTKRVIQPRYDTYSWLEVESAFTDANGAAASVTITVSDAAGNVLSTNVVSSRTPTRVAPWREKEVIVTISSKARIASVTFASSAEELKQV